MYSLEAEGTRLGSWDQSLRLFSLRSSVVVVILRFQRFKGNMKRTDFEKDICAVALKTRSAPKGFGATEGRDNRPLMYERGYSRWESLRDKRRTGPFRSQSYYIDVEI